MRRSSSNARTKSPQIFWLPCVLSVVMLAVLAVVLAPSLNGGPRAESVTYCQLLKTPTAFDGKLVRLTGVYLYSFETQRFLPSKCCEDLDPKTWVEFGGLDPKSRKLVRRFPKGTGMVLGTFVGKLEYADSPKFQGSQFKLTITEVENVQRVARASEISKATWGPPFCKQ